MLGDLSGVSKIFVITGHTDMKKSFDGLMAIVRDSLSAVWLMHAVNFLMPFQKEGKKESGFWISTRSKHWMTPFLQRKMKICFLLKKKLPSAIVCSSRNVCIRSYLRKTEKQNVLKKKHQSGMNSGAGLTRWIHLEEANWRKRLSMP